jgi:predicted AAA+ superfamily ATPase
MYPTQSVKLPAAENISKSPKLQLTDTGMVNYFSGIQNQVFGSDLMDDVYDGKIAEHIVGQELKALGNSPLDQLLFWTRDEKHSQAEVDFVRVFDDLIVPVEVKSGATGRLRSLHQFIGLAGHHFAVRVYSGPLKGEKTSTVGGKDFYLLNLPFYLVHQIDDYLRIFTQQPETLFR